MVSSQFRDAAFRETRWTLVLRASDLNGAGGEEALARLCEDYWRPLFAFIRRRGYSRHDAQDLLQGFFEALLKKNFLRQADADRGHFRTFLLTAVSHFLSNNARANNREKRGGRFEFVSLDAADATEFAYQIEPADGLTPERIFERQWALSVLEKALEALRDEHFRGGKAEQFEMLQAYLSDRSDAPSHTEAATRLGISEGAVRVVVHRMRRRYGELVRAEIAETVRSPADVEAELHYLLSVLGAPVTG